MHSAQKLASIASHIFALLEDRRRIFAMRLGFKRGQHDIDRRRIECDAKPRCRHAKILDVKCAPTGAIGWN
jgi:hypothetical protein